MKMYFKEKYLFLLPGKQNKAEQKLNKKNAKCKLQFYNNIFFPHVCYSILLQQTLILFKKKVFRICICTNLIQSKFEL